MHHDQHGDWSVHRSLQQHKQEFLLTEGLMASSWRSPQAAGLISLSQVNHSASLSGGRFSRQQMHSSRTGGDHSKQGLCSRGGKGEPKQSPPCCTHGAHLFRTCLPAAPQVLLPAGAVLCPHGVCRRTRLTFLRARGGNVSGTAGAGQGVTSFGARTG